MMSFQQKLQECKHSGTPTWDFSGITVGLEGAKVLAVELKRNVDVQQLDLSFGSLGSDGARTIAEGLRRNTTLLTLDISHNNMGVGGAKALAKSLRENDTLLELDVRRNNIGAEGAVMLAEGLRHNATLQRLAFSDNGIGIEGAKALAAVLVDDTRLQKLDLRCNNIGAEGGRAFADLLRRNTALQKLSLNGTNLGEEGARALAAVLRENTSLTELYLSCNDLPADVLEEIDRLLQRNRRLLLATEPAARDGTPLEVKSVSSTPPPRQGPPVPSPSEPFPSFPSFPSVPSSFPSAPDSPTQSQSSAFLSERLLEADDLPEAEGGLDPPLLTGFLDDVPLLPLEAALRWLEGYHYRPSGHAEPQRVNLHALLKAAKACKVLGRKKALERRNLPDADQIASIRLYTTPTMQRIVQSGLCDPERDKVRLRPLGPYLKLLLTALRSLPAEYRYAGAVYRAERRTPAQAAAAFAPGRLYIHWGFATGTTAAAALHTSGQQPEPHVALRLRVATMAYRIADFSQRHAADEVLLEPMVCLTVCTVAPADPLLGLPALVEATQHVEDSEALQL
eukprot:EG_transcript_4150